MPNGIIRLVQTLQKRVSTTANR